MSNFDLQFIEQFPSIGAIRYKASMPSTNDVAKELIHKDPLVGLPLLVLCDQQTAGRGQRGKSWDSDTKSLTFTWCVSAQSLPSSNHVLLPLIAGLSVCEALDSIGCSEAHNKPKLKWPNDILINRQKVCGILVEKISSNNQSWFLIGVGVNVSQTVDELESMGGTSSSFPPGSLQSFSNREIRIQVLLQSILEQLQKNVASENDWTQLLEDRFEFLGDAITFSKTDGEVISGIFQGVDASGRIKLELDGKTHSFTSGQLVVLQN